MTVNPLKVQVVPMYTFMNVETFVYWIRRNSNEQLVFKNDASPKGSQIFSDPRVIHTWYTLYIIYKGSITTSSNLNNLCHSLSTMGKTAWDVAEHPKNIGQWKEAKWNVSQSVPQTSSSHSVPSDSNNQGGQNNELLPCDSLEIGSRSPSSSSSISHSFMRC